MKRRSADKLVANLSESDLDSVVTSDAPDNETHIFSESDILSESEIDESEDTLGSDDLIDSDEESGNQMMKKKTKAQLKKELLAGSYQKPPTKKELKGWGFFRVANKVLSTNNQDAIKAQLNEQVFRTLYTMKSGYVNGRSRRTRARRVPLGKKRKGAKTTKKDTKPKVTRTQRSLTKMMKSVFNFYYKHFAHKDPIKIKGGKSKKSVKLANKPIKSRKTAFLANAATRLYIHRLVLDYYDIAGSSKFLVGNLIKCGMWGELMLVNFRKQITASDIDFRNLSNDTIEIMIRKGIDFSHDHRLMLQCAPADKLIQYIQDSGIYENGIPKDELKYLTNPTVVKFLCDNELLDISKQAIKYYHTDCHIQLLHTLLINNIIKVNDLHIKHVLRKKISKRTKPKDEKKKNRHRYGRRAWRRRNSYNKNKAFNKNVSCNDFRSHIGEYFKLAHNEGINIPIENYTKYAFMSNKMYNEIIDVIGYAYKLEGKRFKFDRYEKQSLFTHVCNNDDIDRLHILLNNNVITIEELHQNNIYIVNAIRVVAEKIAKYMFTELKVKYANFNARQLWGWSLNHQTNEKIIAALRLLKEHEVNIPDELLTTMLSKKKSTDMIDVLINEFDMKIEKKHFKYLKNYSVPTFVKYTQDINYNKKSYISSLVKNSEPLYYWKRRTSCNDSQPLIMHLLSKLDKKEQVKVANKCCTLAVLNNKSQLSNTFKTKYDVNIDPNIIKKEIIDVRNPRVRKQPVEPVARGRRSLPRTSKVNNTYGLLVLESMVSKATHKEDIAKIRTAFTDDELFKLITKKPHHSYENDAPVTTASILKDLKIQFTPEKLEEVITAFKDNGDRWRDNFDLGTKYQTLVANIIMGNFKYVDNDHDYMKLISDLLWKTSLTSTIKRIHTTKHDYMQFLTPNVIHDKILMCMHSGININSMMNMIYKSGIAITPYIYTILLVGYKASYQNMNLWNKRIVDQQVMKNLLIKEKRMVRDTYNKLKEDHRYLLNLCKQKKIKLIDDYEPLQEEIPATFDFYDDMGDGANRMRNGRIMIDSDFDSHSENINVADDLEQALMDAHLENEDDLINRFDKEEDSDDLSMDSLELKVANIIIEDEDVPKQVSHKRRSKAVVFKKIKQH